MLTAMQKRWAWNLEVKWSKKPCDLDFLIHLLLAFSSRCRDVICLPTFFSSAYSSSIGWKFKSVSKSCVDIVPCGQLFHIIYAFWSKITSTSFIFISTHPFIIVTTAICHGFSTFLCFYCFKYCSFTCMHTVYAHAGSFISFFNDRFHIMHCDWEF